MTSKPKRRPAAPSSRRNSDEEVLGALHCERFVDKAPAQVWATLLDEGTYLCSIARCIGFWRSTARSESAVTPTAPSELHQAGAVGRSAEPGLVVGYHEASVAPSSGPDYYLYVILGRSSPATWLAGC